jgi:hypothetical protein
MNTCKSPLGCKGNYAATVKAIVPLRWSWRGGSGDSPRSATVSCNNNLQKNASHERLRRGIMEFTADVARQGGCHDNHYPGCQVRVAAPARGSQSTSSRCTRSAVPEPQVFRCQRPGAGQVRDAAPCACRAQSNQQSSGDVWVFAPCFLPRPRGVSAAWHAGFDWSSSRTATLPQVDEGHRCVCCGIANARSQDSIGRASPSSLGSIRSGSSLSQHRPSAGAFAKKGVDSVAASAEECRQRAAEPWTQRYEDLRRLMLHGGIEDCEGGWEGALVIGKGLVAWMNGWPRPALSACREAAPGQSQPIPPIDLSLQRRQVAQILVSMILHRRQEVLS